MAEPPADHLVPLPAQGRRFTARRVVRFGDVHSQGRVRLDALGAYFQDVAGDDTADAGLSDDVMWVVRRSVFEVRMAARFGEELELTTWCSGLGSHWAERRMTIRGSRGAAIEAANLWVAVDARTGRPQALTSAYQAVFAEAAGDRRITSRLQHRPAPPEEAVRDGAVRRQPWPLRATDFDLLEHVNNAAAWAMVEEEIDHLGRRAPLRAEMEYRQPVERGTVLELAIVEGELDGGCQLWASGRAAGADPDKPPVLFTTARVHPLPG